MKKIILRLDLNVPIDFNKNKILETERIDSVISEIKDLSNKNHITILSHLGKGEKKDSLIPVEKYIRKKLNKIENQNTQFLENVRWQKGETETENSKEFVIASRYFSSFGDIYINDAFASMHRPHASIVGIAKIFKKENKKVILGELAKKEIKNLGKALKLTEKKNNNTLLILSGAKISTKLPLIKKFLEMNTKVFVAGGIANQILKDILKISIGKSYFEEDFKISKSEIEFLKKKIINKELLLPIDAIINSNKVENISKIKENEIISDIGPASFAILKNEILSSKNIIMNGPLGIYEKDFIYGTVATLKEIKKSKANIIIGGGDTLVLTKKLKMNSKDNIFISTGGGAMLEFLAKDGKLVGIEALKK